MALKATKFKGMARFYLFISFVSILLLSGFVTIDSLKKNYPVNDVAADYLPVYKMNAADVRDIISGWPLDKHIIFQFVQYSDENKLHDVIWYEAGGMDQHGENREKNKLDIVQNSIQIGLDTVISYVFSNNYLKVADLKRYVRSLSKQDFDYLEFIPVVTKNEKGDETDKSGYIRFNIRAHYPGEMKYDAYDPGSLTNPSPPFPPS
jgi:hypothetical protein